jgi:multiple sugar transport system permease protein
MTPLKKAALKDKFVCYAFIAPYMIVFISFTILPVLGSMFLSLTSFNMLEFPVFVGAENYIRMFLEDEIFIRAIANTFVFATVTGPVSYILALICAWLINELRPVLRAIVTVIFYGPSLSGNVLLIWTVLFSGDVYGWANGWLLHLRIIGEPIRFFANTDWMMPLIIAVILWSSLGTGFLAFIAGLQGIDRTLYEAGSIDGIRNRWQELWYITLPSMKPQLMFGAVMSITASFGIGSVVTGLAGFPSTDYAAHTLLNHLEDYGGQRFEMGYASAIATILFMIMLLTNFTVKKMIAKVGE